MHEQAPPFKFMVEGVDRIVEEFFIFLASCVSSFPTTTWIVVLYYLSKQEKEMQEVFLLFV